MLRFALPAIVVVMISATASIARADPEPPPPDALVGWIVGGRAPPPLGMIGTMTVGSAHPWFMCAFGTHAGLRVGRLSLIGEGELDVPLDDTGMAMLRGGVDLRLALWRSRGPWSEWSQARRGHPASQRRAASDVFVEAGLGEEMISSSAVSLTRRDLELGAGVGFGGGARSRDAAGRIGRALDFELYVRVRVLVAPSPEDDASPTSRAIAAGSAGSGPSARDVGVFVDLGTVIGD